AISPIVSSVATIEFKVKFNDCCPIFAILAADKFTHFSFQTFYNTVVAADKDHRLSPTLSLVLPCVPAIPSNTDYLHGFKRPGSRPVVLLRSGAHQLVVGI